MPAQVGLHFSMHGLADIPNEVFNGLHHPVIVLVRHVQFQHREFRIVGAVHALVPEVSREFIHAFESTHDKSFEVQFVGNAQIQRNIQRIVMRFEWSRRRTTGDGLQHRCVHFQPSLLIKRFPNGPDDAGSGFKRFANMGIDHEVYIAHAIPQFGIRESIVGGAGIIHLHGREWLQRL